MNDKTKQITEDDLHAPPDDLVNLSSNHKMEESPASSDHKSSDDDHMKED